MAIYRDLAPSVLLGLAARDLAGKLESIKHVNIEDDYRRFDWGMTVSVGMAGRTLELVTG